MSPERFTEIIRGFTEIMQKAVTAEERERCAKIAEGPWPIEYTGGDAAAEIAAKIRSGE